MSIILPCAIALALAYIIGGVNGAIITSKTFYRKDIREYGSGNPGLTNTHRVLGAGAAVTVLIIDVLKTAAPIFIGWWIFLVFGQDGLTGRVAAGLGVVLGHCFPVFYRFKGGKAVLAVGILLFTIDWRVSVVGWGAFILIVLITRYVSLGAVLGCLGYPAAMYIFNIGGRLELIAALLCCAILIARHRPNILRLARGEEPKLSFRRNKNEKGDEKP